MWGIQGKIDVSIQATIVDPSSSSSNSFAPRRLDPRGKENAPPTSSAWEGKRKTKKEGSSEEEGTSWTMPFEIKTGRAVGVMEHRAQTMLYTLLMEDRYCESYSRSPRLNVAFSFGGLSTAANLTRLSFPPLARSCSHADSVGSPLLLSIRHHPPDPCRQTRTPLSHHRTKHPRRLPRSKACPRSLASPFALCSRPCSPDQAKLKVPHVDEHAGDP